MDFMTYFGGRREGWEAWRRGALRRDNPYEPGSQPWKAWDEGWTAACADGYGFKRDD